jgi:hypothetical protein
MSYGLKGKVREIVTRMDARRETGENVNLRSFMAQEYKAEDGTPLQPEHLFAELEINPHRTQFKTLMESEDTKYLGAEIIRQGVLRGMGLAQREQLAALRQQMVSSFGPITGEHNGGQRFVSPEVFMDPVNRGAVQSTFYPDIVIREETVSQPTVTVPKIELSDAKLVESAEAATIEEGSISYGTKQVTIKKQAKAIKQTYESIQFSSLSLVQLFMEDVGRILGHSLNGLAIDTIVNGDQSDLSEAAAVIGVENTTNGITWYDLVRVAIQFGLIGRTGLQAIGNADTALKYLNLPEVKNKQNVGNAILQTMVKTPLQVPEELYASLKVPANKLIVQDPSASLVQVTAVPLMMETERIISKQLLNSVVAIYTGFVKVQRNASIVIDGSIAFSGAGFPAWMQPFNS